MAILLRNTYLEQIEEKQLWEMTITYCKEQWTICKSVDSLLRLMSQAWFLCSYIEQLPPFDENPLLVNLDYSELSSALYETLSYGESYFNNDPHFLCMSGFMMNTHPEWFVSNRFNYELIKENGEAKLIKAYELMPNICSLLYMARKRKGTEEEARLLFPGHSEVDYYFRNVITIESYG